MEGLKDWQAPCAACGGETLYKTVELTFIRTENGMAGLCHRHTTEYERFIAQVRLGIASAWIGLVDREAEKPDN